MLPLCDQTVTRYRCEGLQVTRQVLEGCFCAWQDRVKATILGESPDRKFQLILPAEAGEVAPGDWICQGMGPEQVADPGDIPGAAQVVWTRPCADSLLPHTEAGN